MDKARPQQTIRDTGDADGFYNQGNALQRTGAFADAVASYDRALAIRPDWAEALTNRGVALRILERPDEAVTSYDRALAIRPTFSIALSNRGHALRDLGRSHQALASYEQALAIQPQDIGALIGCGMLLQDLGRPADALEKLARALMLTPSNPEVLNLRGNALRDLNRLDEALTSYARAIAAQPDYAGAFYNRANVLQSLGRLDESLADYGRALAAQPNFADAFNNRGNLLLAMRKNAEAANDFDAALKINPDYPYARGKFLHARMRGCDWASYEEQRAQIAGDISTGKRSAMPQEMFAISDSPADQLRCARAWIDDKFPQRDPPLWQAERYMHDRIRVAYLSADLHDHAVGYLIAGVIEHHDRTRFEITALSTGPDRPSDTRARLHRAFDHFIEVRDKTDLEIARLVREREIDIVVDLNGHTGESRTGILAYRAAPTQVNFLGYAGTMGADYVDYVIADRMAIPGNHQSYFAEKTVWLPDTFFPADDKCEIAVTTPTRSAQNLPEQSFVFCAFNNSYKITPEIFDIWMGLLRDVDGSVLWLSDTGAIVRNNLQKEAAARGIPAERLVFAPRTASRADHLARQRLADLFLDTSPYNAHTTACDALWAGLPVLTFLGTTFAARVAASLLQAIEMPELIANSRDDYRAMALQLARDPLRLSAIKAKLLHNRGAGRLFNTARFTRHLEAAYTEMWKRNQKGEPSAGLVIE